MGGNKKRKRTARSPLAPGRVVGIGASAGGLEALERLFATMDPKTGAAFVVVLHLSPDFKSLMPELLSGHTTMPVSAATHETRLRPDHIYIIPPGKNMILKRGQLLLSDQDRKPGHGLNLPIDLFLRSLAEDAEEDAIAVILSGTGSDGSRGIRSVKESGGLVFVQEPSDARFDGMPVTALDTGVVDDAGTAPDLASHIGRVLGGASAKAAEELEVDQEGLERLVVEVRAVTGLDLGYFRPSMFRRRVQRRLALLGIPTVVDYAERLAEDPAEVRQFTQDMLIGVTGFFRDPEAFERLKRHVAEAVLPNSSRPEVRVWVPACASGEEVYSLAIVLHEAIAEAGDGRSFKIFATDLDPTALLRVGKGSYTPSAVADVGAERLARYFVHGTDTFTVIRELRENVIVARHNMVTDPPFTKIDLVSCRNFLIYVEPEAQEGVLASIHFSLRQGGTLFLGAAESVARLESEFKPIDAKYRIYSKTRDVVLPTMRRSTGLRDPLAAASRLGTSWRTHDTKESSRLVLDALLEKQGRSAAVVTAEGGLLEVLGDPMGVFQVPKGRPTADITRIAAGGLAIPVTTGLQRLRHGQEDVRYTLNLSEDEGEPRPATLRLRRLEDTSPDSARILVLVEPVPAASEPDVDRVSVSQDSADRMRSLEDELQNTRESLHATIEELQSSNEEQQSTNEELVASNEELQSTNEELQSVNEELQTVNEEYQKKIQELAEVAADLDNLLRSLEIGTLFLDRELRIRKFTPSIQSMVRLVEHDVGRSIEHFSTNLGPDFVDDATRVLEHNKPIEREIRNQGGEWVLMRVIPYLAKSDTPQGVVVTFVDVTALKNAQEMTRMANEQLARANNELSLQRDELEDLFSIVAHDLKRPVLALTGLLGVMGEGDGVGVDPKLLPRATDECQRMRRMLDDLAQLSGQTRFGAEVETVDLEAWLDALADRYREAAAARGVRFNSTCDAATIDIGKVSIEEICVNLLENALNYGCTGDKPRIDVSATVDHGNLVISVRDNGIGIDPKDHRKVFEPFRRLDPDAAPGSGIGLVAARRLVSHLGGTIDLDSTPGRGAKFTVRVPIGRPDTPRDAPRFRVLLVEDDRLDAKTIERYIGDTYGVTRVESIAEAEAQFEKGGFDAVLLDLSLPDGHGFELIEKMRYVHGAREPVVVITGHGDGIIPEAMTASIAGYVDKAEMTEKSLRHSLSRAIVN